MREHQAPDAPIPSSPPDLINGSHEDFNKRLADGGYGDHDWSQANKVYLRASGLI
jgi:hypothetical protein